jgi:hypothetical protein
MNEMLTDSASMLRAWHMSGTRVVLGTREVLQGPFQGMWRAPWRHSRSLFVMACGSGVIVKLRLGETMGEARGILGEG